MLKGINLERKKSESLTRLMNAQADVLERKIKILNATIDALVIIIKNT